MLGVGRFIPSGDGVSFCIGCRLPLIRNPASKGKGHLLSIEKPI